jgi:hypothetical protein
MRALALLFLVVLAQDVAAQSIEELQRQVRERDARIRELGERIEALENKGGLDEELSRALERTLVQQGALLLPPGAFELQPQLGYSHWDPERSTLRHQYDLTLGARAGLPRDYQVQVRVPYVYVSGVAGSGNALGDTDVALSKQLRREAGVWPGTLLSLGWTSRTGRDGFDGRVPTGSGFNSLQVGFTAVKRQDPLVYTGTISYADARARTIEGSRIDPGSTLGLRLGGVLAAAPDVSLSLGVGVAFVGATRLDGQSVTGTDTVISTLQLGLGASLTRSMMLILGGEYRFSGNVGLTNNAPNFRLTAALPVRF